MSKHRTPTADRAPVGSRARPSPRGRASSHASRPGAEADAAGPARLLGMDEAIAALATTRPTFYRWLRAGTIAGIKVGRQWRFRASDIERFLEGKGPRIDLP